MRSIQDDLIVRCAQRLEAKQKTSPWYKWDGKYPKAVQAEIERMKKHCQPINTDNKED